jgi:hypothetical protein
VACVLVLIFCLVEAVWSWASIRGGSHREDLVDIVFFAFVIFVAVSIAYRSPFWADRVVFGAIAGAFALSLVRFASLMPVMMLAVDIGHALMWTIATAGSLAALTRGSGAPRTT